MLPYEVPATSCPRISASFLAEEKRNMPPMVFESEYSCVFTETTDSVFRFADIAASMSEDVEPLWELTSALRNR